MRATLHERKSTTKPWSVAAISSVLRPGLYARLVHDWDSYIGLPLRGAVVCRVDDSGCVWRALLPFPNAATPWDYAMQRLEDAMLVEDLGDAGMLADIDQHQLESRQLAEFLVSEGRL